MGNITPILFSVYLALKNTQQTFGYRAKILISKYGWAEQNKTTVVPMTNKTSCYTRTVVLLYLVSNSNSMILATSLLMQK